MDKELDSSFERGNQYAYQIALNNGRSEKIGTLCIPSSWYLDASTFIVIAYLDVRDFRVILGSRKPTSTYLTRHDKTTCSHSISKMSEEWATTYGFMNVYVGSTFPRHWTHLANERPEGSKLCVSFKEVLLVLAACPDFAPEPDLIQGLRIDGRTLNCPDRDPRVSKANIMTIRRMYDLPTHLTRRPKPTPSILSSEQFLRYGYYAKVYAICNERNMLTC